MCVCVEVLFSFSRVEDSSVRYGTVQLGDWYSTAERKEVDAAGLPHEC